MPRSSPVTSLADVPVPQDRAVNGHPGVDRAKAALVATYVVMLSVQLPLGADHRLAVSDLCVIGYLFLITFRVRRLQRTWTVWYAALLAVMGMGLLVALMRTGTVSQFAVTQKAIGLAFLMVTVVVLVDFMTTAARVRWVLDLFVVGVVVHVVVAVAAYVAQQGDPTRFPSINFEGARLSGFDIDPNAFGGFIATSLLLHVVAWRSSLLRPWFLRHAASIVLTVGLVLTFSRSAWIAATAGLLVAIATTGASVARAVLPLFAAMAVAIPWVAARYLPDLAALAERHDQVSGRITIVSTALAEFRSSPVFGIGLGNYEIRHGVIVHNTLVWFLAELGLVGFLVLIGFLSAFILNLVRVARRSGPMVRHLALAVLAANAAMMGLSVGIEALYQREWWLLFAAGAALGAVKSVDRT